MKKVDVNAIDIEELDDFFHEISMRTPSFSTKEARKKYGIKRMNKNFD